VKAYILRINDPLSIKYAKGCAESCDAIDLDWEYVEGYQNMLGKAAWCLTGIKMKFYEPPKYLPNPGPAQKANCCSAGHGKIWKMIAEGDDEVGIVLEHDAIMYYKPYEKIPDNYLITLGYKLTDPSRYDHKKAGPPNALINITGHEGAHAYMMTKRTAQNMVHEIEEKGVLGAVDNAYFIRGQRRTNIPLCIMSPTPAMGWLRESTIWSASAAVNYEFIPSFAEFYK